MSSQVKTQVYMYQNTLALPFETKNDSYDITLVISGTLKYVINGKSYSLNSGDGLCVSPNEHCIRLKSDEIVNYISINFSPSNYTVNLPHYLPNVVTPELNTLLDALHETTISSIYLSSSKKRYHLLSLLLISLEEALQENEKNPHVDAILDYISKHYTDKITLEDISNAVNLSVPHCCHVIKNHFNTSIFDIVLTKRIDLAKDYISQGTKSLLEISQLCGFNDYGYFSKHFKKATGVAPSHFLK